jgi:hypothetical protein
MVDCLDDEGPPDTVAGDLEFNPGDRYCQLGDSAHGVCP